MMRFEAAKDHFRQVSFAIPATLFLALVMSRAEGESFLGAPYSPLQIGKNRVTRAATATLLGCVLVLPLPAQPPAGLDAEAVRRSSLRTAARLDTA